MRNIYPINVFRLMVFLVGLSHCGWGQSVDPNRPVRLADYLALAEANNAQLQAALEMKKAAEEEIPQAKTLSDPVITYGYAIDPTPQRSEFEVMQMIPWPGTLGARGDRASAMARAADKQYEAKKLAVDYEVAVAFYEYYYLGKAIEITQENLDLLSHLEQVARAKYIASTATHPDVIRTQIELAELENELVSLEKKRPALAAQLNSLINRPIDSELPWPAAPEYAPVAIDRQTLAALISANNPELKEMDYQIEAALSGKRLAEKRFYPEISIGVAVSDGMGQDMGTRTMPKIQMSLPLWRGNYGAGERQALAQLRQAKQEKVQKANSLAASAENAWYEFENSARKITLYRGTIIPKAREMLAASETAYQADTIEFMSLIDAQRKLLEYRLMYERMRADNAQRWSELEMLAGRKL